jgi:tetratricopeptide (TPR) repeat protein
MIQSTKADCEAFVRSSKLLCDGVNHLRDGKSLKAKGCFRESLQIYPSALAAFYLAKLEKIAENHSYASAISFALLEADPSAVDLPWFSNNINTYLGSCIRNWQAIKDGAEADAWVDKDIYNVCIVSAAFQREQLLETFIDHYKRASDNETALNIDFAIAVSEGDGCREICLERNVKHVLVPNTPLSCKWQAALDLFMTSDCDYCLVMGSDDFMSSSSLVSLCDAYTKYKCAVIGIRDLYIAHSSHLIYWNGYSLLNQPSRYGESIGAGRLVHRSFVNLLSGCIWGREIANKGLDGIFTNSFRDLGLPTLGLNALNLLGLNLLDLPPLQLAYDSTDIPIKCLDVKLSSSSNVTPASSFLKLSNIFQSELSAPRLCEIVDDVMTSDQIMINLSAHSES